VTYNNFKSEKWNKKLDEDLEGDLLFSFIFHVFIYQENIFYF
jgi:hypothetical protein